MSKQFPTPDPRRRTGRTALLMVLSGGTALVLILFGLLLGSAQQSPPTQPTAAALPPNPGNMQVQTVTQAAPPAPPLPTAADQKSGTLTDWLEWLKQRTSDAGAGPGRQG